MLLALMVVVRLLVLYILYNVSRTIYDLYFGPLSRVPGPKLAAISRLLSVYHMLKGDHERWIQSLHDKYGDVVRKSPTEVSFATGDVWREIYGYAPGSKYRILAKETRYFYFPTLGHSILTAPDKEHARLRKMFAPAFSDGAVNRQEPLVQGYVDRFIANLNRMANQKDQRVNIADNYNFYTFDVMADLAFAEPLGCLQNSEYAPWVKMIFDNLRVSTLMIEARYFPLLNKLLLKMIPKKLAKARQDHINNGRAMIGRRLERDISRPDIWGLSQESKEEEKLTRAELELHSFIFMVAGSETGATLLSGVTYLLLMNLDKLKNLVHEIRTTFSSEQEINGSAVAQLTYLNACLEEALRVYPPVPTGLPRVTAKGGTELSGYRLPEDTIVYIHMLSLYHNPKYFRDPKAFVPERWLKPPPPEYANDDLSAVHPFLMGPGVCIGRNLAYLEVRLVLTNMLYHFDLEICAESKSWLNQRTFRLWEKKPLMVSIKSRGK